MSLVIGGYPDELFVVPPSTELICPVCHDVFKNPHQCKNGHNFCLTCITQAVESHRECPVCKTFVAIKSLSPSLALRNIIEQLSVRCKSNTDSALMCHWSGKLVDLDRHKSECTAEMVSCPLHLLGNCTKCVAGRIPRGKLDSHFLAGLNEDTPVCITNIAEKCVTLEKKVDEFERAVVPGHVVVKFENGDIYSGEMLDGVRHGQGVLQYGNSDEYYSGTWKNGKKSGFGVEKCILGVYSGEFIDDKRVGYGCFNYGDGKTYSGTWKDDEMDGHGICTFTNGKMYSGTLKHENFDGYGTLTWTNGSKIKYEGYFKNCGREGQGKLSYTNGDFYNGNWTDNKKSGHGVFTYANGLVYTGQFLYGKFHGNGTLKAPDGTITEGVWENGKRKQI